MRHITDDPKPSQSESLSEQEIKRALLFEALQHPATSVPLALCIMSAIWLGVWPNDLGRELKALILLIVSAVIAVVTFFWRYSVQYDKRYALKTEAVMALLGQRRSESEEGELRQL